MHAKSLDGRLGLAVLHEGDLSKFPLGPLIEYVEAISIIECRGSSTDVTQHCRGPRHWSRS